MPANGVGTSDSDISWICEHFVDIMQRWANNVNEKVTGNNTNDICASHSCNMRWYQRNVAFLSTKMSFIGKCLTSLLEHIDKTEHYP